MLDCLISKRVNGLGVEYDWCEIKSIHIGPAHGYLCSICDKKANTPPPAFPRKLCATCGDVDVATLARMAEIRAKGRPCVPCQKAKVLPGYILIRDNDAKIPVPSE